jgi:hypothetical protein
MTMYRAQLGQHIGCIRTPGHTARECPGTILSGHEDDNLVEVEEVQNVDQLAVLLLFSKFAFELLKADKGKLV